MLAFIREYNPPFGFTFTAAAFYALIADQNNRMQGNPYVTLVASLACFGAAALGAYDVYDTLNQLRLWRRQPPAPAPQPPVAQPPQKRR